MPYTTRAAVALKFEEGDPIIFWDEFTYQEMYTEPVSSFTFTVSPGREDRVEYRDRLVKGAEVTLHIDGRQQARMLIVEVEQTLDADGFRIAVSCESLITTIYEASVDPFVAQLFQSDTPMADAITAIFAPHGFGTIVTDTTADVTAISGKSLSGRAAPVVLDELTHKDISTAQSESALGFANRLVSRVGLAIRSDYDGKPLLGSPDYEQAAAYTVVQDAERQHRGDYMLAQPGIKITDTNKRQFSETLVIGKDDNRRKVTFGTKAQGGVRVAGVERPTDAPFSAEGLVELPSGRHTYVGPWKPRYKIDKKSRDKARCTSHATLLHCQQSVSAYTLTCAVAGLKSKSGDCIWAVDTIGRVIATEFGVDEDMWLLGRVMSAKRDGPQMTQLTWIPKGALLLGGE